MQRYKNLQKQEINSYHEKARGSTINNDSEASCVRKWATSYSPASHCSTIGADGLNFSVRNGKRWNPDAIITQNGLLTSTIGKTLKKTLS